MDNKELVLLSKFSVSARRLIGSVNPAKLLKDCEYSAEVFSRVAELGDEELVLLSLEVQSMLGLMNTDVPTVKHVADNVVPIKPVEENQQKYMFGARS